MPSDDQDTPQPEEPVGGARPRSGPEPETSTPETSKPETGKPETGPAAQAAGPGNFQPPGEEDEGRFAHIDMTPEQRERVDELVEQFGEDQVTELMLDAAWSEEFAEFLLEAHPRMSAVMEAQGGKAEFYLHREMRTKDDEYYVMKSPRPQDFRTQWTAMLNPQLEEEDYARLETQLLQHVLVHPTYEEVDWERTGEGVYSPKGLTKNRLVNVFWEYETQNGQQVATDTAFGSEEVGDAVDVAESTVSEKPSL